MQEMFGEVWPAQVAESHALYNSLPEDFAQLNERNFRDQAHRLIEEHSKSLKLNRIMELWRERTGTTTPDEWSLHNKLPACSLLKTENARMVIETVSSPEGVSAERLDVVCEILSDSEAFISNDKAGLVFIETVLPKRYLGLDIKIQELCNWLSDELDSDPNQWFSNHNLNDAVESFVRECYRSHVSPKALAKINKLSDVEARNLLVRLVKELPDAGLVALE